MVDMELIQAIEQNAAAQSFLGAFGGLEPAATRPWAMAENRPPSAMGRHAQKYWRPWADRPGSRRGPGRGGEDCRPVSGPGGRRGGGPGRQEQKGRRGAGRAPGRHRPDGGPASRSAASASAWALYLAAIFSASARASRGPRTENILAKKPDDWSKGMVLCITVEFYAILSLLASMLMIINMAFRASIWAVPARRSSRSAAAFLFLASRSAASASAWA